MTRKLFKEDDNYRNYFTAFIIWGAWAASTVTFIVLIIKDLIQILN